MTTNINYPVRLLNIELAQQASKNPQLELFSEDVLAKVNRTIDEVLKLQQTKDPNFYYVYFPIELERKLSKNVRSQITKEITANEVRVFTAVVIMAQIAKAENRINYIEGLNRAYFELDILDLYKIMGIEQRGGKQRQVVKDSLWSLNRKRYALVRDAEKKHTISISHLVEVHEVYTNKPNILKVTVEGLFFDFERKISQYFHVPSDINTRLRKVTTGRPNAQIELFIKCLYQAKHCSQNNQVEYSYKTIFDLMHMHKLVENGHRNRVKDTMQKAFDMAKKIDLVKEVKEGKDRFGGVKYIIKFK